MKWSCKPPLGVPINRKHPLVKGLVGYWLLNEAGGNKVYDLTGNNHTGTLTNMALPPTTTSGWNSTPFGPGLAFDGSNDYVTIPNFKDVGESNSTMSVVSWVKAAPAGAGVIKYIVDRWYVGSTRRAWSLGAGFLDTSKMRAMISDDGTINAGHAKDYESSFTTFGTGWHQLAFTFDRGVLSLFADGVYDTAPTKTLDDPITTVFPSTDPILIGSRDSGGYLAGNVDRVGIYTRPLSPPEVAQLYYEPWGIFDTPNVYPVGAVITPFACAGTLVSSGTLLKTVSDLTAGGLALSGLISKELATGWAADFASDGTLSKTPGKIMGGTLASTAALLKVIATGWAGTLGPGGVVVKSPAKVLGGDLATSGTLTAQFVKILAFVGTLATSGGLVKLIHKLFGGDLDDSGTYTGPPPTVIAPLPPEPGTCVGEPQSWMRRGWFTRGRPRGSGIYGRVQAGRLRR